MEYNVKAATPGRLAALGREKQFSTCLEMDDHKRFTGNELEAVKKARLTALEEFRKRYTD